MTAEIDFEVIAEIDLELAYLDGNFMLFEQSKKKFKQTKKGDNLKPGSNGSLRQFLLAGPESLSSLRLREHSWFVF
jgi:hypothetical protein